MSPPRFVRTRWATGLASALTLSACDRKIESNQKSAAVEQTKAPSVSETQEPAPLVEFESLDPRSIPTRGAPATEGRYSARPAVVASPCGLHLVVSEAAGTWTALLVGHELSWTKEGAPLLLRLDGLTLDVGLVDARTMGSLGRPTPAALLQLAGQWESTWLRREAGANIPIKDNASGQAHLEPHPAWRVWSATLGPGKMSADVAATNAVVATVALGERVLVLRALLNGEELALRALRRLVFAVDSIERHSTVIGRREYVETLQKAVQEDPTCAAIHDAHDAQLE